jgi:Skp family chaperone for outer membrane proteins
MRLSRTWDMADADGEDFMRMGSMKLMVAAAAALAVGAAFALAETPATPPAAEAPAPASKCPALIAPPALPETIPTEQVFTTGTDAYNAWRAAMEPIEACRAAEIRELQAEAKAIAAKFNARVGELRAADAEGRAAADKWVSARNAFIEKNTKTPAKKR